MKVVSKRRGDADPIADCAALQRTLNRLRNYLLTPRGVFRFHSMREADEWMTTNLINTHAHLKSKT